MKKIFLIVLMLLIGLAFFIYSYQIINKKYFLSIHFPNGYSSRAAKIGEDLIVYTDSSTNFSIDSEENFDNCDKNPLVYLIKQGQIKSVFEIKIGDFCVTNDKFIVSDDLVISEWIGSAFGSGGLRVLILWKTIDGELQPIGGYPNDSEVFGNNTLINVVNLNNPEQNFSYPLGDMNAYSAYLLKNPLELRYAEMIWKVSEESHSQPHQWYLVSYVLSNDKFIRNPNWNNGEAYITKEKIDGWGDEVKGVVNKEFDRIVENN